MNPVYRRTTASLPRTTREIPAGPPRAGRGVGYGKRLSPYPLFGTYSLPLRRALSITDLTSAVIFTLLPLLIVPVFLRLGELLCPWLRFFPRTIRGALYLRPPTGTVFFHEMLVLVLAVLIIALIQIVGALIFFKKSPWGESVFAGGFLTLAVYGVLRGFQLNPADALFFPLPALCGAAIAWVLIAGVILYPYFCRIFSR